MAAAGLQRSSETFRRSGSSGLVWEDRFLPGEQPAPLVLDDDKGADDDDPENKGRQREGDDGPRMKPIKTDRRHRTGRSPSPTQDPPSPRVSACGFCALLFAGKSKTGKTAAANRRRQR